jgi:glycosyltransferase involved in cell wall biosynthesis
MPFPSLDTTGRLTEHVPDYLIAANLYLSLFLHLQQRQSDFDLLHIHGPNWASLAYSSLLQQLPIIYTLHLPPTSEFVKQALQIAHTNSSPLTLTTVSQRCQTLYAPFTPIDAVIHNGVDVDRIPYREQVSPQAPLLFAGRICPAKGVEEAIEIAERAGKELVIAGTIGNRTYYDECVAPRIAASQGRITYLNALKREELWPLMSQSYGLLFPVQWEEPFGLVIIEALAAGTPAIAFRRGAIAEIIHDGQTGFVVEADNIAEAAAHVHDLAGISRTHCRKFVETHFSLQRMGNAYERLYQQVITSP